MIPTFPMTIGVTQTLASLRDRLKRAYMKHDFNYMYVHLSGLAITWKTQSFINATRPYTP